APICSKGEDMAGPLEQREQSFEAKWARDEEYRFKIYARRNRLLGLWGAGEMRIAGDAAQVYAGNLVKADFEKASKEDVFDKIRHDFDATGIAISDHMIRRKMDELLDAASRQIRSELSR